MKSSMYFPDGWGWGQNKSIVWEGYGNGKNTVGPLSLIK